MALPKIGIVLSTTREGRFADKPKQWLWDIASQRFDLAFEILDLRDYPMPLYGEPVAPMYKPATNEVAQRWSAKLVALDGYIFVTAEYNAGIPPALKNALDHIYPEVKHKPAAYVGYGGVGAARAIEHLRLVCSKLHMAPVPTAVNITLEPLLAVMQGGKNLAEFDFLNKGVAAMLDDLAWWAKVLKEGRNSR